MDKAVNRAPYSDLRADIDAYQRRTGMNMNGVASALGYSNRSTLTRNTDPFDEGAKTGLAEAEHIALVTGGLQWIRGACARLGGVFIELPDTDADTDADVQRTLETLTAFTHRVCDAVKPHSDGGHDITAAELASAEKAITEHFAAVMGMLTKMKVKAGGK